MAAIPISAKLIRHPPLFHYFSFLYASMAACMPSLQVSMCANALASSPLKANPQTHFSLTKTPHSKCWKPQFSHLNRSMLYCCLTKSLVLLQTGQSFGAAFRCSGYIQAPFLPCPFGFNQFGHFIFPYISPALLFLLAFVKLVVFDVLHPSLVFLTASLNPHL